MNKKFLAGIGISGALMLGSVYSISADSSGYDLYKEALKKTHTADSATMALSMSVEDNGTALFTTKSLMKTDVKDQVSAISTMMANGTETSEMNMYKQNGSWFVTKEGTDPVYKMDIKNPHHKDMGELKDDMENLIDVMTKNLQKQITVEEAKKGSHVIELDLTGKEIPLTANALSTLMIKHANMIQETQEPTESSFHIKATLPELDHDINVKQIKLTAKINKENYVEKQTVKAVVTGKDKHGQTHELELTMLLNVSDYNQTKVTPVEIPAEKVEVLDMSHGHSGR
jgi:hypothetical protein